MNTNQLPSEQFRIVAKEWVAADAAARILEETKTAVLSQRMNALGDMPVSKAERIVKGSADWTKQMQDMVNAREKANLAKVKMEYYRMKAFEWQSENANRRSEMRLTG